MDEGELETAHEERYAEGTWQHSRRLAWELTLAAAEDREDRELAGPERERWAPASWLLALALWRAARADGELVARVPLVRTLWWLGDAEGAQLYEPPLPPLPVSWTSVRHRAADLEESARWVVTWHIQRDLTEHEHLADTGEPPLELLVGDRCRAVASGHASSPRWQGDVEHAECAVNRAIAVRGEGSWARSVAVHATAEALTPTLRARPAALWDPTAGTLVVEDEPPGEWAVRLMYLRHVRTTLAAVLDQYDDAVDLDSHPAVPFGNALAAALVALSAIVPAAVEVEELWEQRRPDTSLAPWERAHVPASLRAHIVALERLLVRLRALCWDILHADDEE
ncbi:hypothetical protein ACTWQF_34170 [Streptomyces sp. 8N114]|uniref:hypothetical protein n=1 Tax=Streptomyces sp. 8N114 TaxID=3457419 RepID=UPI003FD1C0C6